MGQGQRSQGQIYNFDYPFLTFFQVKVTGSRLRSWFQGHKIKVKILIFSLLLKNALRGHEVKVKGHEVKVKGHISFLGHDYS